jgi:aspartate carbamoyltransferase regulatory subunit
MCYSKPHKRDNLFTPALTRACEIVKDLMLSKEDKENMQFNEYPLQEVNGYRGQWFKSELNLIELNKLINTQFYSSIKEFSELKHDSYIEIDLEYVKTEAKTRLLSILFDLLPEELEIFNVIGFDDLNGIKIHKIDKGGNNTRVDYILKSWNYKPILVETHNRNMDSKLFLEAHEWGLTSNKDYEAVNMKSDPVKPKSIKSKQIIKLNGSKVKDLKQFFKLTLFQLDSILNAEQIIENQQIVKGDEVLEEVVLTFNPKDECFTVKHVKDGIVIDSVKGTNKYKLIQIYNHLIDEMEFDFNG